MAAAHNSSARVQSIRLTRLRARKTLKATQPADVSVLSIFSTSTGPSLTWYRHWLQQQFEQIPADLKLKLEINGSAGSVPGLPKPAMVARLFIEVSKQARKQDVKSIQSIYEHVKEQGLFQGDTEFDMNAQRTLVFTLLGWQTMLYTVAFHAAPFPHLSIQKPLQGSDVGKDLRMVQSQDDAKLPLDEFLYGYGQIFPPSAQEIADDVEAGQLTTRPDHISPQEMNWFLLDRLCNISITWIENVSHHMSFDHSGRVLYLFRYPSFAARCLATDDDNDNDVGTRSVLHAFAAPQHSMTEWPCEEEIDQLLREIILSYKLLFGQSKRSRKAFRSLQPFKDVPKALHDRFLFELCGKRSIDVSLWATEKDQYHLPEDFPILRDRISTLQGVLNTQNSRGFRQVWRNRQYTEQWYGFWAILAIGLMGLLLAVLQVILQGVQVALAFKALP